MIRQDWSSLKKLLFFQMAAGGAAVEATATGNPLTFVTDLARPLKSLLIPFTPQQEGSGDPSPQNIRSIIPWNGLSVFGGGANIIDETQLQDGYVWWNGSKIGGYNANCCTPLVPVKSGATYYRQGRTSSQNAISFFDKERAFLSQLVVQPPASFIVPSGAYYAGFTFGKDYKNEAMVNAGSSALPYEPYVPITDTDISFPSPVYGGEHEAVSGMLMAEWYGIVKKWSEGTNASTASGYTRKSFAFPVPVRGVNGQYFAQQKCNIAKLEWSVDRKTHFYIDDSLAYLWLPEDTDGDQEIQLVSKLVTPQEIQLTPAQLTALVGDNTIWSDADGSMTATYLKKG